MKLSTGYKKPVATTDANSDSYLLLAGGGEKVLSDLVLTSGDLMINGVKTFSAIISGSISGNASTATRATADASGNTITAYYLKKIEIVDLT